MKSALLRLWKHHMPLILTAAAILLYILSGIGCPIRRVTTIPCPACGMTRAWLSLLHGDLLKAFFFHPLFLLAPLLLLFFFYGKKPLFGSKRKETLFAILMGLVFLICYLYRLFFDPTRSIYA